MKAIMSVGALIGVVGILLLAGMVVGIVPSNTVRLIEGYMPVQVILELTLFVAGFTGISYLMASMGMAFPRFWQGILFWAFILLYLKFRVYPPIPFSVRAMYGTVSLVAIFMWVSANEEDWKKFKQPIMNVLDAKTGGIRILRYAYLIILPLLIVLSFRIDTIGVLRRLKCVGLSMHLSAGWWRRMYRPQLNRLL